MSSMSQSSQDRPPTRSSRSSVTSYHSGASSGTRQTSPSSSPSPPPLLQLPLQPSPINAGAVVNRIVVGGEERRNFLSARYWRFREWARHSDLNVPVGLPEEKMNFNGKKSGKTSEKKDTRKYEDEPPGFRWVEIEIK